MKIAVIGGGASGMVTAYLLDKQGHSVTVFERQPMLGGHIRTLNKNVKPNCAECTDILESGALEFPTAFHNFIALMQELDVELEPIDIGSALFFKNGDRILSKVATHQNFAGLQRLIETIRFNLLHARSAPLWLKTRFASVQNTDNQPLSQYLGDHSIASLWLKLLTLYSYSIPLDLIDDFPAKLAIPMLRDYIAVSWLRVKGGVYSYIEKILERFKGKVLLDVEIAHIYRSADQVKIEQSNGEAQEFDKVVFATPPDQVMTLLADPTEAEIRRFSGWKANVAVTTIHTDTSVYENFRIHHPSEFDFFQTNNHWGYNSYLNQLCGLSSSQHHFLSFQLEEMIDRDRMIHQQQHYTPLYTTDAFQYRDEVIEMNGEHHTYHAGAYLGDGLHEGAITSALRVARLIGSN
ncbi:MAG: FAD-dependent oxidoreductase [Plectolyngbya sp. WJT66-NPBG17]|jgi:predicted NAD/FAD-binding protein|nr:FAD-dependent oxidoreductase [Plectolyngbya sp. WJT66-NPBG17]MBW4525476.1 FAD-dependent oxidoreductase [Phormidium tanganyikae FI6-MK23]